MNSLRIVFAGTPAFGLPCLNALAASKHQIAAIYTQPDRPAGRGRNMQASAIKQWGLAQNIPIYQPLNFKDQKDIQQLKELLPDVIVVIAYGLILPKSVLSIPRLGCINVHASSLPRWRGASPIQHAILHGDKHSGITIMQMDVGMDTGDILNHVSCDIKENDTAETLHDRLASIASHPLLNTLDEISLGRVIPNKQNDEQATYAPKINKEDALINWQQPAFIIDQQIRAFNPWPIAYTQAADIIFRVHKARVVTTHATKQPGTILSIDKHGLLISTTQNAILIENLQFPGGKPITVADYMNSRKDYLSVNMVLGIKTPT